MIPRNGRRSLAHAGPCSKIFASGVKYLLRVSVGGEPAMKALQNASAVSRILLARISSQKEGPMVQIVSKVAQ